MSNEITFLYKQGEQEREITFSITTQNVPIGSTISLNADKSGPNPPIVLDPTKVTTSKFTAGITTNVPSNYSSMITLKIDYPDGEIPQRTVSCTAYYPSDSIAALYPFDFSEEKFLKGGPVKLIQVMDISAEFQKVLDDSLFEQNNLLGGTKYSFTKDGITIEVNANLGTASNIQGFDNVESTILEVCLGITDPHSFGKSCTGDWGNSQYYVHIKKTSNQDLLGYANVKTIEKDKKYSIDIDATGVVKDGKHKFNVKGKF